MPYSYRMTAMVLYSAQYHRPLNSLEHCVCTTSMTNIQPSLDSKPISPQPDRVYDTLLSATIHIL